MCGIAGILVAHPAIIRPGQADAMREALVHRGPDQSGSWKTGDDTLYLLHQRLRILDLSDEAAQPMRYLHYTLVFNGEIYNYPELKKTLIPLGYTFRSSGDTEVIAAAYDHWGIDFLHQLDGMFAFALYDDQKKKLIIARDRMGEKPLYFFARYAMQGKLEQLLFASEIKSLLAGGIPAVPNPTLLLNYLSLGYVQNPVVKTDTFYKEILSLPPGYWLDIDTAALRFTMKRWYEPFKSIGHLDVDALQNEEAVTEKFYNLLLQSVRRRLRSDVPVGTSLSGGIDSSSIVAVIDALKKQDGPTGGWANVCFSAIFPGFAQDESVWSEKVADTFGIRRYTVTPGKQDLSDDLGEMLFYQDEPVESSSALSQFQVYRAAADMDIRVLLDGQGADEILAGYKKYSHWYLQQMLRKNHKAMRAEKRLLAQNGMLEQWGWQNYLAAYLPWQTAKALQQKALRDQETAPLQKEWMLQHRDPATFFKSEVRHLEDLLYFNTFNFGLEALLRYADRNSMANSREVRLPFLNHELVAFVFSLPAHFKIRQGFGKWILRKSMEGLLPGDIAWRKGKVGFEPPQQQWLQDSRIHEQLMESRRLLAQKGILDRGYINQPIGDAGAHAGRNYDWRILCAAHLLGR